ncbi:unnamed protein product [Ectocarpus sp. 12 AP-2014]
MWSSKEVLFISIATGFVFCFATIYAQNAVTRYVNRQVQEKTGANPLIGMGLVSRPQREHQQQSMHQQQQEHREQAQQEQAVSPVSELQSAPPGSGARWTPLPT